MKIDLDKICSSSFYCGLCPLGKRNNCYNCYDGYNIITSEELKRISSKKMYNKILKYWIDLKLTGKV